MVLIHMPTLSTLYCQTTVSYVRILCNLYVVLLLHNEHGISNKSPLRFYRCLKQMTFCQTKVLLLILIFCLRLRGKTKIGCQFRRTNKNSSSILVDFFLNKKKVQKNPQDVVGSLTKCKRRWIHFFDLKSMRHDN